MILLFFHRYSNYLSFLLDKLGISFADALHAIPNQIMGARQERKASKAITSKAYVLQ